MAGFAGFVVNGLPGCCVGSLNGGRRSGGEAECDYYGSHYESPSGFVSILIQGSSEY
jgi:hypothetical protein